MWEGVGGGWHGWERWPQLRALWGFVGGFGLMRDPPSSTGNWGTGVAWGPGPCQAAIGVCMCVCIRLYVCISIYTYTSMQGKALPSPPSAVDLGMRL